MDYKEKATILRVCSSKKGERCSRCPAFGQGNRNCLRNAMKDGATAITDLLARAEAAEAENVALRKIQPVQLDDTGAQALALAAEVSELKQNLSEVEMVKNAAISDLKWIKSCAVCRYCDSLKTLIPIVCQKCRHGDKWEWRGQKEE